MFKSSKSPPIDFARSFAVALVLTVFFGPLRVPAQQPAPTPSKPKAYIRLWNMLPADPANNLLVSVGDNAMFGVGPLDLYTDYFSSPLGSYSLTIKRSGDKADPGQKIPVALQDGTYITLLATQKGTQTNIEVINDTPDPKVKDLAASLIVRSFLTGARVTVGVAGGQVRQPVPDNATVTLDNLPMTAEVNISVQAMLPTTPPSPSNSELPADFSVTHHATLLLVSDRYGRLKSKLFYSGRVANLEAQRQREKDGR